MKRDPLDRSLLWRISDIHPELAQEQAADANEALNRLQAFLENVDRSGPKRPNMYDESEFYQWWEGTVLPTPR